MQATQKLAAEAVQLETARKSNIVSPDNMKAGTVQQSKSALSADRDKFVLPREDRKKTLSETDNKAPSPHKEEESNGFDDEDDSSNDDSSYFADPIHLPKPKSDQRFSWPGNNASNPSPLPKSRSKESDASLSLSDDSDTDNHTKEPQLASFPPSNTGFYPINNQFNPLLSTPTGNLPNSVSSSDSRNLPHSNYTQPELYPQQLTRMHSASSLVSGSSASDTSIVDELRDVAVENIRDRKSNVPSGRLSPILGEHPPSRNQNLQFTSPSTVNPGPSPPQLLESGGVRGGAYLYSQAHPMTPQNVQAWNQFTNDLPSLFPNHHATFSTSVSRGFSNSGFLSSGSNDINRDPMAEMNTGNSMHDIRFSSGSDGLIHSTSSRSTGVMPGPQLSSVDNDRNTVQNEKGFKIYWQRWVMLFYMSLLNLLSDWTCYSVAPIALLTEEAFGRINAEELVTIFLIANAVASACEPMILARLGLRRTVLFGALLLMIGNITKSGGMPPIIQTTLKKGSGEWRVYSGFFIVGLSQPLYQCTPALLSASWFPEAERTLATSVALNANQLGIGFAFIFGTLLVADSNDIPSYFSLLSIISTLAFLGTLIQFSDAPPTPPSETAKVVRGTLEVNLPTVSSLFATVRNIGQNNHNGGDFENRTSLPNLALDQSFIRAPAPSFGDSDSQGKKPFDSTIRDEGTDTEMSANQYDRKARRRSRKDKAAENTVPLGSRAVESSNKSRSGKITSSPSKVARKRNKINPPPSPALGGQIETFSTNDVGNESRNTMVSDENTSQIQHAQYNYPSFLFLPTTSYPIPDENPSHQHMQQPPFNPYQYYNYNPYGYATWQPNFNQYAFYYQQQALQHGYQVAMPPVADQFYQYYSYQHTIPPPPHLRDYEPPENLLPPIGLDEGVEPVLTITPHHLDINIRDDQIILSVKACMARPGFVHSLVSFTVSGIVINTLSTFMDYLVRLNGAGREYTGIVGGSFQFVIMISSLIVGQWCDKTRAYYSITIGMLVLGAFGLAECGVSLDADRGNELRWALIVVAALVGPLQPISTELGVDVVYPLSENTVLVVQQLFSNLLSAFFIPCFKAMRDVGRGTLADGVTPKPQYTFSFYLLIVLHAVCTVFFATFNGRYLRYEHEQDKLAEEEKRKVASGSRAFQPPVKNRDDRSEFTPLLS